MKTGALAALDEIKDRLGTKDVQGDRSLLDQYTRTLSDLWLDNPDSQWLLLPYFRNVQGLALFGTDDDALRRGLEVVTAFFGPRIPADSRSSVVNSETLGPCPVMLLASGASRDELDSLLERALILADLLLTEPPRPTPLPSSVPVLLRDFGLSLERGDYSDAEALFDAISDAGLLSATNLIFLEVGLLAAGARWYELRNLPDFEDLTRVQRPRLVAEQLAEAIWHVDFLRSTDAEALLRAYLDRGTGNSFGGLLDQLAVHPGLREGPALLVVLRAREVGDEARLARISQDVELPTVRNLISAQNPEAAVLEGAVTGARTAQRNAIEELIADTIKAGDAHHAQAVLELLDSSPSLRPSGPAGDSAVEELRSLARAFPHGWSDWLAVDPMSISDFEWAQLARDQGAAWTRQILADRRELSGLADALLHAFDAHPERLCMAFDVLVAMSVDVANLGNSDELLEAMLTLASVQESPRKQVLDAHETLVSALLARRADRNAIGQILDSMEVLIPSAPLSFLPTWLLNTLDMLLDSAPMNCRDQTAQMASLIVPTALSTWSRWSQGERERCKILLRECGLEGAIADVLQGETPSAEDDLVVREGLQGTVVGLYSLNLGVIKRFEHIVRSLDASVKVESNSEHDASKSLEAFAQRCDWLVVDVWHAKHEATKCISRVRSKDRQILPLGRGGSGMFMALRDGVLSASQLDANQ